MQRLTRKPILPGLTAILAAIFAVAAFSAGHGIGVAQAGQNVTFIADADTADNNDESESPFQGRKMKMLEEQIVARGIDAPETLSALKKVDRHRFVPEHLRHMAYEDRPLPIGEGQTISQPYIVAFMTQALDLKETDRVLEIGTGSGYQAAVLAEIVEHVYTIEIIESLGLGAKEALGKAGYTNIDVKIGDGFKGWPEHAPFDAIMVTAAPTDIPAPLKEQLAEGGTMIIPVGQAWEQELIVLEKKDGQLHEKKSLPVRFVPMVDEKGETY